MLKKYAQLYAEQDYILTLLARSGAGLYLSGGTALHRFIFSGLRYSDDLDFFSIDGGLGRRVELVDFINFLRDSGVEFRLEIDNAVFKRLILKSGLKIDLILDSTPHLGGFDSSRGFLLDNVQNIFCNKLEASLGRNELRDFFDLFIILKNEKIDLANIFDFLSLKTMNLPEEYCANLRSFEAEFCPGFIPAKRAILQDFLTNYKALFCESFDLKNFYKS